MRTIYKFPFQVNDDIEIVMPGNGKVVKVDAQGGVPTIWAEVDPEDAPMRHQFILRGTGHPIPDSAEHVSSFFHGPFVWHLYR